ncbi:Beta-1,3-galactosyltransferase 5 [Mizuhopecten yessoensis]|uniref:Hexosyltransferase n=1 Tax=Mizuhopecten yessoensis TaxID=6573 RepID=A0A210Q2S5_MIZYE|nr:Beta-1,3-galactosyltransferase 5 [Mizuhopecten yessoensis]
MYVWERTRSAGCRRLIFVSATVSVWFFLGFLKTEPYLDLSTFFHQEIQFSKPFLIQPNLNCNQLSNAGTVIIVISKASNSLQRLTIRRTWGQLEMQKKYSFRLFFLLGTEENINLDNEINLNGDIVQTDITESYYHLTEKTVNAFKWMTFFCHNASFEFLREIVNDRTCDSWSLCI